MAEHPNATLVRNSLEAFNRGDMEQMNAVLADDVEWHEIGRAEARHGKAALAEAGGASDAKITVKIHDVVANDDHTVVLAEATAIRDAKTFTYRTTEILHVKDGKITERWAYSDDTAAIIAFFA